MNHRSNVFYFCFWKLLNVCVAWSRPTSDTCQQPRMLKQHSTIHLVFSQKQHFRFSHTCSSGLRSEKWAGLSTTLIVLVWNQDAAHFRVIVMLKNPSRRHFLFWNNATRPLQDCFYMQIDPWSLICGKTGPTQLYDPPMTHLTQTPQSSQSKLTPRHKEGHLRTFSLLLIACLHLGVFHF